MAPTYVGQSAEITRSVYLGIICCMALTIDSKVAFATPSLSDHLTFDQVIDQLRSSPQVEGVAEFGSRTTDHSLPASDYDLLILVKQLPVRIFQLVTTIDGRLADVVLADSRTIDAILALDAAYGTLPFFERLFVQKMQVARIWVDKTGQLQAVKQRVTSNEWQATQVASTPDVNGTWFWQSFTPLHIERMAQSDDPIHATAVDMMLTACLPGTWRAYFDLRMLIWRGEKAALRYWAAHDPEYLGLVRRYLETPDRPQRVTAYRALMERTIQPIGAPFSKGETALIMEDPMQHASHLRMTLDYWNGLFATHQ